MLLLSVYYPKMKMGSVSLASIFGNGCYRSLSSPALLVLNLGLTTHVSLNHHYCNKLVHVPWRSGSPNTRAFGFARESTKTDVVDITIASSPNGYLKFSNFFAFQLLGVSVFDLFFFGSKYIFLI